MASQSPMGSKADDKADVVSPDTPAVANTTSEKSTNKDVEDPELNALLDSVLADFDKQPKHSQSSISTASAGAEAKNSADPTVEVSPQQEAAFNDLFSSEGAEDGVKEFEETMRRLMQQDPEMMSHFEKITQMAGNPAGDAASAQQEFAATLAQTLSGMAQNAEGLKEPMSEEDFLKAFGGMGLEGAEGGEGDFMPMMQGMMKNLLSKEVLYPSLKEISEKYPKWLEDNKDRTEEKEFKNYEKQYTLMKHICSHFEAENPNDSDSVQNERFEKILDLMQQMQELGHPPKDIVGEMAPGLEFDENGLPKFPPPEQCCVM